MASRWYSIAVDCRDPRALGAWWARVLDYKIVDSDDQGMTIGPDLASEPRLDFFAVPEEKTVKNRLHIDLQPDDQKAEVARLVEMGARHVDVGQGDVSWVVLADPEGNEFCVLSASND